MLNSENATIQGMPPTIASADGNAKSATLPNHAGSGAETRQAAHLIAQTPAA